MKIVVVGGSGLIGSKLVTAVFDVDGRFSATQARCTHRQGSLSEGMLDGSTAYAVTVPGDVGRVDVPVAAAVQGA